MGELTSFQYNGASVVDYMMASPEMRECVHNFKVMGLTQFSDHCPLICSLKPKCQFIDGDYLAQKYTTVPVNTQWVAETSPKVFQDAQEEPDYKKEILEILHKECHSSEDVVNLNTILTDTLVKIGEKSGKKREPKRNTKKRMQPKNRWYDASCICLKRELNILAKKYGKNPTVSSVRLAYYSKKKEYKKHIKRKKYLYFKDLNNDILHEDHISWKDFNKLRNAARMEPKLDLFDIENFFKFFKGLYKRHTIPADYQIATEPEHDTNNMLSLLQQILNKDVELDELKEGVKGLKTGKAAGEDMIINEFLKNCKDLALESIQKLFNGCLEFSVYPWNTTTITPLHKKGCPHDPDNYRAIAVGSNLGKLFSTILLNRLLEFRSKHCPDTPNQRGFCKGAQTADHIFSLNTCIQKYVKHKRKRLYSCFVDFQKAFDTVSREALLYKLDQMGIQGRFFKCLQHMYKNSSAKLKMVKRLSECFDIEAGTEQGHPLSPELFKCYIHELSVRLNNITGTRNPLLNNVKITHLLWADDLVLLALDKGSLQAMIDELNSFCGEWGLIVNLKKTAVLVFNNSGRQLLEGMNLTYGETQIPSVREYCYLGTTFAINGSQKINQKQLRIKGLKAYFSLKRTIDLTSVAKSANFKLFDALIAPVVSYGCQVWLPGSELMKCLVDEGKRAERDVMAAIARDPMEKLHLSLLKWTLGVRKKTTNIPIWGDCGRFPIGISMIKLMLDFHNRLVELDKTNSPQIVRHAFVEQSLLELDWFKSIKKLTASFDENALNHCESNDKAAKPNSLLIKNRLEKWFLDKWDCARKSYSKLAFYNKLKEGFGMEPYLQLESHKKAKYITWLRTSSHLLNVETGRYGSKISSLHHRTCDFCSVDDKETLELLVSLPTVKPIIEDEMHFLKSCPRYNSIREDKSDRFTELLKNDVRALFLEDWILEFSNFVFKLFRKRFQKEADGYND